jgi:hypothetical protein
MAFEYTRVRIFRVADCDTDHYLMVAKVIERLAIINRQHRSLMGMRYNLGKLNEPEVGKQYQFETANRFCSFGNLIART